MEGDSYTEGFGGERELQGQMETLEGLGVDGEIIMPQILKNCVVRMRNGLIWLRIEKRGGLLCGIRHTAVLETSLKQSVVKICLGYQRKNDVIF
jgi:hypothetical protein